MSYDLPITYLNDFKNNKSLDFYKLHMLSIDKNNVEIKNGRLTISSTETHSVMVFMTMPFIDSIGKKYRIALKNVLGSGYLMQNEFRFNTFKNIQEQDVISEHTIREPVEGEDGKEAEILLYFYATPTVSFSGYEIQEIF